MYAFLAKQIGAAFFPVGDTHTQLLQSFSVFAGCGCIISYIGPYMCEDGAAHGRAQCRQRVCVYLRVCVSACMPVMHEWCLCVQVIRGAATVRCMHYVCLPECMHACMHACVRANMPVMHECAQLKQAACGCVQVVRGAATGGADLRAAGRSLRKEDVGE